MSIESVIRNAGKNAIESARSYFYDLRHKKEAMQVVNVMERYNGGKLTPKLRKTVDEYAVHVFGSKRYAPWLYVYTLMQGEFREGWIPDNFYGKLVIPNINKSLDVVAETKTLSNVVLKTESLSDIGYFIDGVFYDKGFSVVSFGKFRKEILDGYDAVFVKKDGSAQGRGVVRLATEDFTEDYLRDFGNCVIQSPITQHPFFDEIVPGLVTTLRITTVKEKDGSIGMRASYLRTGFKGMTWYQSDRSIRVAIVNGSGGLDAFGYAADWRRCTNHPDTGFSFENKRIPNFENLVAHCIALHKKVPHFTIVGWDTTIGDDGEPKLMEWNTGHTDIKFSESTTGPCFVGLGWERFRDA